VRLMADYGLFAAAADRSGESLAALAALVPARRRRGAHRGRASAPVPGTRLEAQLIWQMAAERLTDAPEPAFAYAPLHRCGWA